MCTYILDKKEAPYPRVAYKGTCGFQYVKMEGYKFDVDNGRTNELWLPDGNCMKCKEPINVKV